MKRRPARFRGRAGSLIVISAALSIAAANSGNGIYYLVAATLLGLLVLSKAAGKRYLSSVTIDAYPPPEGLFANRQGTITFLAAGQSGRLLIDHPSTSRLDLVSGRASKPARATIVPSLRGKTSLEGLRLAARAPYGLTGQSRRGQLHNKLLVYPEPDPDYRLDRETLFDRLRAGRGSGAMGRGPGTEFLTVRKYQPGDGLRRIYWKGLARSGKLLSRVDAREEEGFYLILLNDAVTADTKAAREAFEAAVSRATTAVLQAEDSGRPYRLDLASRHGTVDKGRRHRDRLLQTLALVQPRGDAI